MARLLIESKCKNCRKEGLKLFLKGSRCDSPKCSFERNARPPGQHGAKRRRLTDYGLHFREKQKVKRIYGLLEKQFRRYFHEAQNQTGNTGENLLILMERRLDNILYRGGMATSRMQARQYIQQGHITVNGHKMDISSTWLKAGDVVKPGPREKSQKLIKTVRETTKKDKVASWLQTSDDPLELKVVQLPQRTDISIPINEQLVVEFSSR